MTNNRTFGGHTVEEVRDLLDGLCRAADRCEANSQQEIAAIAARGRDALRALAEWAGRLTAAREAVVEAAKEWQAATVVYEAGEGHPQRWNDARHKLDAAVARLLEVEKENG